MRSLALLLVALATLTACGTSVVTPGGSGDSTGSAGGAGGSSNTAVGGSSSTTGDLPCTTVAPGCLQFCGSDFFPAEATCENGSWVCPAGTVDETTCPPSACGGIAFSCEACDPSTGWSCQPTADCVGTCPGIVCAECPTSFPPGLLGGCQCSCTEQGFSCTLGAGCCNSDADCGDAVPSICAQHVCKAPASTGCWADEECQPGQGCKGAVVCPCGAQCDAPDSPGSCQG